MKQFYLLSTLLYALAISNPVSAQITIDEIKTDPSERILKNEVRPTTVDAQSYFSCARYRAERAAIRKERNTLEFGGGILGSVASYSDSWIETSGGDNSIGLAATLGTAPLVSHLFGIVPLAGLLINPAAIALATVVVFGGALWLLLPIAPLAAPLAWAVGTAAEGINTLARLVAALPGGAAEYTLGSLPTAGIYLLLAAGTLATWCREPKKSVLLPS